MKSLTKDALFDRIVSVTNMDFSAGDESPQNVKSSEEVARVRLGNTTVSAINAVFATSASLPASDIPALVQRHAPKQDGDLKYVAKACLAA